MRMLIVVVLRTFVAAVAAILLLSCSVNNCRDEPGGICHQPSAAATAIPATQPQAAPAAVSEATSSSKWNVLRDRSQLDDSPTVVLRLEAENDIHGWLATATPSLINRC